MSQIILTTAPPPPATTQHALEVRRLPLCVCAQKHYIRRDSSVGISTRYGMDGTGIESRWGRIFRTRPHRPWGPPSLPCSGHRVIPGGKAARAWR
jgi:hypothetical protein